MVANVVEDDIVTLLASREIFLRVVDDMTRADRSGRIQILRLQTAVTSAPKAFAICRREGTYTARGTVDQDLLSGLDVSLVAKSGDAVRVPPPQPPAQT